jgi:hypothetical protein
MVRLNALTDATAVRLSAATNLNKSFRDAGVCAVA